MHTRRTSPSLFSSTEPWNFFGLAQTRVLESKIPPTCLHQQDRTLIKRVHLLRVFYPSLLQNLLSLLDRQSNQALVEAFQNVGLRGFKLETFNSVHYLTNLRSTLLVTSRISCYEVAFAGLSERRDAAKIELARSEGGCGPRAFFASLFTVPLYHYLGAWNRLVIM